MLQCMVLPCGSLSSISGILPSFGTVLGSVLLLWVWSGCCGACVKVHRLGTKSMHRPGMAVCYAKNLRNRHANRTQGKAEQRNRALLTGPEDVCAGQVCSVQFKLHAASNSCNMHARAHKKAPRDVQDVRYTGHFSGVEKHVI